MKKRIFLPSLASLCVAAAVPLTAAGPFQPDANMERAKVPDLAKWNLTHLYADDAAFQAGLKQSAANVQKLLSYEGKLQSPASLRECLDHYFTSRVVAKRLSMYGQLKTYTNLRSSEAKVQADQSQKTLGDFMAASAFIRREVMALSDEALAAATAKEPKLQAYQNYLQGLRRRKSRVLSSESERILSLAGDHLWSEIDLNEIPSTVEEIYKATRADAVFPAIEDEQGKKVQLNFSNFGRYRASKDRRVRRDAVSQLFGSLKTHQHLYAATLSGEMNFHVFLSRSRGYATAIEAYTDKDNIPVSVYKALIDSVHANLAPLHRYVQLRKKALKLPDVHLYDLYTPLVKSVDIKVTYDEACKHIQTALAPLGQDYGKMLATGLDPKNGWVDIYPHKDKDSGASANFVFGVHPYVKMNYFDSYDDMSTLAHEYGHAMQQHFTMTKQPIPYSEFSLTLSEIPSTFNEKLLSDYFLAKVKNDDEKLYILAELVESLRTTIYRQTLFAEFELALTTAVEKGESLTAEALNSKYKALIRQYYGKDFVIDEHDDVEWAYIPHFYYKFYTYSYALGLASGIALGEKVQSGDIKARDAYLEMISSGGSKSPLETLKLAGVDLTKPDAVNAAARLMDKCINEMEQILDKQGTSKTTAAK